MRKNTLLKLLAVCVMCFLIGAALVSCGESETTENTDIKAVVAIELKDGKLFFSYNDGTVGSIELPEATAAETCDHVGSMVSHVLVKHEISGYDKDGAPIFTNDKILYVCNKCNSAEMKYVEPEHNYADCNVVTAPTCTEKGYAITKQCIDCGAYDAASTEIIPELGHDWGEFAYVAPGNDCDGGVKRSYCKRNCGVEPQEQVIPENENAGIDGIHTVADWAVVLAPTATSEGMITGTCTVAGCGDKVDVTLGKLPNKVSNDEYTYDVAKSDVIEDCGDGAKYAYIYKANDNYSFTFYTEVAGSDVVKHSLNGKLMTSVEQVAEGEEFENAYYIEDYPDIITFKNHPVVCYEAVLAHFICDAVHDDGNVCGADISVYVKAKHVSDATKWENVPTDKAACSYDKIEQTQVCVNDGCTVVLKQEVDAPDHEFEYKNDTLYVKNGDNYVDGFDPSKYENRNTVPYYQGICKFGCGEVDYQLVPGYKYELVKAATCDDNGVGEGKVSYTKASDGKTTEVKVVIAQLPHETVVNGERVAIVEGKDGIKTMIYNADHADYKDLVKVLDNVPFSADVPVLGYIHCECECEGVAPHDVTVWVQKLGANAPAMVAFN